MQSHNTQPTGAFLFSTPIDEDMRRTLEQMFNEGASEEQIRAVCPSYQGYENIKTGTVQFVVTGEGQDAKTVEGSVVEPITDEGRLLN